MADENPTNDDLISEIVKSLRASPEADQVLVELLTEHILKLDAADPAVDGAAVVIEELALERGELGNS